MQMTNPFQVAVLKTVEENWPVHIKELVRILGLEVNNSNIKRVSYHVQQLEKDGKIITKRIGLALAAWPMEMEKLRVINEMLRG